MGGGPSFDDAILLEPLVRAAARSDAALRRAHDTVENAKLSEIDFGFHWDPDGDSRFDDHVQEAEQLSADDLGQRPADLLEVLTDLALAAPGVCALRALSRVAGLTAALVVSAQYGAGTICGSRSVRIRTEDETRERG